MSQFSPYQQRVIEELDALDGKISRLQNFIQTPVYAGLDEEDRNHLAIQLDIMMLYSRVLGLRIQRFDRG